MGQETLRKKDEELTGRDLPNATGEVSQEDIDAITDENRDGKPTGQDHSTENYEETEPDSGVGAIQDSSNTMSDIARLPDNE
ncbi:MAG TPA: hypothetical protein VLI65_08090 [Pyrinomonadaceae bacterium]|nr:hypothetical protein [Pyrinomonadaceae bacterium]